MPTCLEHFKMYHIHFRKEKELFGSVRVIQREMYRSTVKTLATVRRLALPRIQINVARQQVNQLNAGGAIMKGAGSRSMMPFLRAYLEGGSPVK